MRSQRAWMVTGVLASALALPSCAYVQRWESRRPATRQAGDVDNRPVSVLLKESIGLVGRQIEEQRRRLSTAQTDLERQAVKNHLDSLRQEQELLEELHEQLIGPYRDLREAAREQQADRWTGHDEKTLEQDQRFPTP